MKGLEEKILADRDKGLLIARGKGGGRVRKRAEWRHMVGVRVSEW